MLLFGEMETGGHVELTWDGGGSLSLPVEFGSAEIGETVWLLQGSRLITDWESRYPSVEANAPLEKRQQSRVAGRLVELSRQYGLASREMSLVAVVARAGDHAGQLPDTRVVPMGMAQDTRFSAYFPAQSMAAPCLPPPPPVGMAAPIPLAFSRTMAPMAPPPGSSGSILGSFKRFRLFGGDGGQHEAPPAPAPPASSPDDELLTLASAMDSDGGMPGRNAEARASASVVALLAFLANGHTPTSGAFRSHVARLVAFLESLAGLDAGKRALVDRAVAAARQGKAPKGDWLRLAHKSGDRWPELSKALAA